MGSFHAGWLWVQSKEGRTLPPRTAPGLGPEVKARNYVANGKWLNLDGAIWHAITPTRSCRLSLVHSNSN
eukprot:12898096-Prorocentrum_lima.AAC.1